MGRSSRKVVPIWSDESMYNTTPVPDPFFRNMEEYTERRKTLQFSPVNNGYESSTSDESSSNYCRSVSSETSYQYNERIKRENKCFKCCSVLSFIACCIGVSIA